MQTKLEPRLRPTTRRRYVALIDRVDFLSGQSAQFENAFGLIVS